jgi:hypothetical protein
MANIVIVRLDLDQYDVDTIQKLVLGGVITLPEARTARCIQTMEPAQEWAWAGMMQRRMKETNRKAG